MLPSAAAVLFDALGSKRPNLTMQDFSSDHAAILQRIYNFLCSVIGSDPRLLQGLQLKVSEPTRVFQAVERIPRGAVIYAASAPKRRRA
jgi:hypothetical protein